MVTIKRKKRARSKTRTINRNKQSQRNMSAIRGALIGRTAASSKQVQRSVLRTGGDKVLIK
jgi:hypothetical protein